MITVNSDGNPLSQAFLNAIEQPLVGFDMKVFRNGSDTGWGVKRASIDLGAGDADMGLADFELGTVCSAQAELQLYGGTPSVGEVLQLRVGVDVGGSYEYVTVANVASTSVSVFGGISTVQCVGRWASRLNRPIASGTMSATAAASAIGTAGGFSVTIGEFQSTSQTVDVEGTVRDALSALAKRLGGFAVETPEGYLVSPFQRTPTYALPTSFATSAPRITGELFTADGLEVITAETSYTYGTGRVKCDDPTATAETSAVTWGNIQGYSYQPGNVKVAIIDPRVTPADLISVTVDGTAWNLPARGISITYDGGYFGTYSAAGLTLTMEESLMEGELTRAASTAKALAQGAQAVAEAVNQHFWDDDSGAHVTEVTKDEWHDQTGPLYQSGANSLWNSLGMLFRKGLTNLMALVVDDPDDEVLGTTGVAIYDGQGNATENIVASYTSDGVQIGQTSSPHLNLDQNGVVGTNDKGLDLFSLDMDGSAITTQVKLRVTDNRVGGYPLGEGVPMASRSTVLGGVTGNVKLSIQSFRFDFGVQLISATGENVTLEPLTPYGSTVSGIMNLYDFDSRSDYLYEGSVTAVMRGGNVTNKVSIVFKYTAATKTVLFEVYGERNMGGGTWSLGLGWNYATFTSETPAPSFSFGTRAQEPGVFSFTSGESIIAENRDQVAFGRYNEESASSALIIGNGDSDTSRSNALTVDWNGSVDAGGAITAAGRITGAGLTSNGANADFRSMNVTDGTAVTEWTLGSSRVMLNDSNNINIGWLDILFDLNGKQFTRLYNRRVINGITKFNGFMIGLDANGNPIATFSDNAAAAAFRNALGFSNTFTSTVSQVISAASGFTISQANYVQNGQMAQWYMTVKNTNAMSANTQHTIGTIVSGKRPATWAPVSFGDTSNAYGNGRAVVGGSVIVRPSANIAAGTTFFLLCPAYILA